VHRSWSLESDSQTMRLRCESDLLVNGITQDQIALHAAGSHFHAVLSSRLELVRRSIPFRILLSNHIINDLHKMFEACCAALHAQY